MRSVKVRDYMVTNLVTFHPDTELFKAIEVMLERRISGAPVVDSQGKIVGLLSEWDCLSRILQGSYYKQVGGTVSDYMQTEVHTAAPGDDIVDVADTMTRNNWRPMPIVENGKLVGILSCPDILQVIYDFDVPAKAS